MLQQIRSLQAHSDLKGVRHTPSKAPLSELFESCVSPAEIFDNAGKEKGSSVTFHFYKEGGEKRHLSEGCQELLHCTVA